MNTLRDILKNDRIKKLIFLSSNKKGSFKIQSLNTTPPHNDMEVNIIRNEYGNNLEVYLPSVITLQTPTDEFKSLDRIEEINFNNMVDLSEIKSLDKSFYGCCSLEKINFGNYTFKNLKTATSTFKNCRELMDIGGFDFNLPNIISLNGTFEGCILLESLDFKNANMPNIQSCEKTFAGCEFLKEIDMSKQSLDKVTSTAAMFSGCYCLESVIIKRITGTTDSHKMFENCNNLKTIDINMDYQQIKNASCMFDSCFKLEFFDFSKFQPISMNNMQGMFKYCYHLKSKAIFDKMEYTGTSLEELFAKCENITEIDMSNVQMPNVETLSHFAMECKSLQSLTMGDILAEELNMEGVVCKCEKLIYLSMEKVNAIQVSNANYFATDCHQLKVAKLGVGFGRMMKTSGMFFNCENLKILQYPNHKTNCKHEKVEEMFNGCKSLRALNFSNFKMNAGTIIMFNAMKLALVYSDTNNFEKHKQMLKDKNVIVAMKK